MEAAELDVQLEELEIRLERLRALYEQYFLGIEKLEPTVARKDVDRRIYILRREKIRNTGKRFKLQTIIQRYNTFQQYWHRICREIENGTYRRHVQRAERAFGPQDLLTIAARKRFGREQEARAAQRPPEPEPEPVAAAPEPQPAPASPPAPAASPPPAPAARHQQYESLELDMDFLGDWDPASARRPAPKPAPAPVPPATKPAASAAKSAPPAAKSAPPAAKSAPPAAKSTPPAAKSVPPTGSKRPTPIPVRVPTRKALPRPEAKPPAQPKPAAASPSAASLNEARLRELHGKLNELKRQNREPGQVSFESLAKSLRATEEKLRKQHTGRRIDFDVVVKDGKAVVKPIVR